MLGGQCTSTSDSLVRSRGGEKGRAEGSVWVGEVLEDERAKGVGSTSKISEVRC